MNIFVFGAMENFFPFFIFYRYDCSKNIFHFHLLFAHTRSLRFHRKSLHQATHPSDWTLRDPSRACCVNAIMCMVPKFYKLFLIQIFPSTQCPHNTTYPFTPALLYFSRPDKSKRNETTR